MTSIKRRLSFVVPMHNEAQALERIRTDRKSMAFREPRRIHEVSGGEMLGQHSAAGLTDLASDTEALR
jgi:hypothetical protein